MLRGGGRKVPLSLGEEGDTSGAVVEARETTRYKLVKCGPHPKKSLVLAQVGRVSSGTVSDAPGWRGSVYPSLGEEGDTSGALEEARGTTRHKLVKCGRHPKFSLVLAQVGRGSLGTIPDTPG